MYVQFVVRLLITMDVVVTVQCYCASVMRGNGSMMDEVVTTPILEMPNQFYLKIIQTPMAIGMTGDNHE
jgi:hypothetical protein